MTNVNVINENNSMEDIVITLDELICKKKKKRKEKKRKGFNRHT